MMTYTSTSNSQTTFSQVGMQGLFEIVDNGQKQACKRLTVDKAVNLSKLANNSLNNAADAEFSPAADLPCRLIVTAALTAQTA
jgi:hypothetical protein